MDTTAAMAGAISGALNGAEAVPPEYWERLKDQGEWRTNELFRLCRHFGQTFVPVQPEDLPWGSHGWPDEMPDDWDHEAYLKELEDS